MRGKRAKELRRIAREQTVGLPVRNYREVIRQGKPKNARPTIELFNCERAFYKGLKKTYKSKQRKGEI
jgi:hypothetical protein